MRYDPKIKPQLWNIQTAIVAYNCKRMGLPMPVGLWWMPEGGGNKTYDYSGQGNTATPSGTFWTRGGIEFDSGYAGSDIINLADNDINRFVFSQGTMFLRLYHKTLTDLTTVHAWAVRDGAAAESIFGIERSDAASRNGDLDFYCNGNNHRAAAGVVRIPLNTDTDCAVTWDGTNIKYYVEGVLKATVASGDSPGTAAIVPSLGNRQTGGRGFDGWMYIFVGFDVDLFSAQIVTLSADPYGLVRQPDYSALFAAAQVEGVPISVFMHHYQQIARNT